MLKIGYQFVHEDPAGDLLDGKRVISRVTAIVLADPLAAITQFLQDFPGHTLLNMRRIYLTGKEENK